MVWRREGRGSSSPLAPTRGAYERILGRYNDGTVDRRREWGSTSRGRTFAETDLQSQAERYDLEGVPPGDGNTKEQEQEEVERGQEGEGRSPSRHRPKETVTRQTESSRRRRQETELRGPSVARSSQQCTMGKEEQSPREECDTLATKQISTIEGERPYVNDLLVSLRRLGFAQQVGDARWLLLSRSKVRQDVSWLEMGLSLLELVCRSQCHLGNFLHDYVNAHSLPLQGTQRGLLPLPLPPLTPVTAWLDLCDRLRGREGRQQKAKASAAAATRVWLFLSVLAINYECMLGRWPKDRPPSKMSKSQAEALRRLEVGAAYFAKSGSKKLSLTHPREILASRSVDYSGSEVKKALDLVAAEIEPGLPPQAIAASVELIKLCDPLVAEWLADPWTKVLPEEEWPEDIPPAPVHCSAEEWGKLCRILVDRRMFRTIELHRVFHAKGKPVFIGAFAGEKKGALPEGVARVTRLIMNCVTNSYLRCLVTDLKTLLSASGWCNIVLWNGCYIVWSSDDMKGAYYVLVVPDEWGSFMTFSKQVPWTALGEDRPGSTYVCSRVLAMGSSSAVALFQHIHRRTGLSHGLRAESELRRNAKTPFEYKDFNASWCQYFLDDADCPLICPEEKVLEHVGKSSAMQTSQRLAAEASGLTYSEEKAVE